MKYEIGTYLEEKYRRLILFRKKKNTNLMLLTYKMKKREKCIQIHKWRKMCFKSYFFPPVKWIFIFYREKKKG